MQTKQFCISNKICVEVAGIAICLRCYFILKQDNITFSIISCPTIRHYDFLMIILFLFSVFTCIFCNYNTYVLSNTTLLQIPKPVYIKAISSSLLLPREQLQFSGGRRNEIIIICCFVQPFFLVNTCGHDLEYVQFKVSNRSRGIKAEESSFILGHGLNNFFVFLL